MAHSASQTVHSGFRPLTIDRQVDFFVDKIFLLVYFLTGPKICNEKKDNYILVDNKIVL